MSWARRGKDPDRANGAGRFTFYTLGTHVYGGNSLGKRSLRDGIVPHID
jgi:hypothetical protein